MPNFHSGLFSNVFAVAKTLGPGLVIAGSLYVCVIAYGEPFDGAYLLLAVLAAVLTHILLRPVFDDEIIQSGKLVSVIGRILFGWFVVMSVLLALGAAAKVSDYFSRLIFFTWVVAGAVLLPLTLTGIRKLREAFLSREEYARKIVIAGINEPSLKLAGTVAAHPQLGLRMQGFFEDRSPERIDDDQGFEVLGRLTDLPQYVRDNQVDIVFVALPMRHIKRVIDLLDELHDTTASIYYVPDYFVFDLIQSRAESVQGMPVISLCETPFFGYRGLAKRMLDIVVAGTALIVMAPLLLAIAVAIKLDSKGPVLFRQRRYGLDGAEIPVYKFRSMSVMEDGAKVTQARRDDDRITKVGGFLRRTSLDELPQLLNVLQGSMSLVGPRPHAIAHNEEYRGLIKGYMIRHKVPPGITGWAQVNGYRGETARLEDMQFRVEHDLDYLRNWSFMLDIKILFMTAVTLWKSDKAY